jgi:hypothetical protein
LYLLARVAFSLILTYLEKRERPFTAYISEVR